MAAYDLEEQEQLAEIKAWWKQYGNLLMNVLTAMALVLLAWQGWNWYQRNQSAQASQVYHVLTVAVQAQDNQRIKAASGELLEKFSASSYASLGALTAAKTMVENGDAKTAKAQLQWVVEKGGNEVREIARLRLATLLLDEKAYDEALKVLDGKVDPAFEARFADVRGDILAAQGKQAEAITAWKAAMTAQGKNGGSSSWQIRSGEAIHEIIQLKLDALGGSAQ